MLHPSYADLMQVLNSEVEPGESPVVNSRYSVVLATAKRARQLAASTANDKTVSYAINEIANGKIKCVKGSQAERFSDAVAEYSAAKEEIQE